MTQVNLQYDSRDLYDDAGVVGELYGLTVNPNLTKRELAEAEWLMPLMYGNWFVSGPRGSGKDEFTHTIGHKARRFFGKRILLDHRPRRLFGEYTPFNPDYLLVEVKKMAEKSGTWKDVSKWGEQRARLEDAADSWLAKYGEVTFRAAFLVIAELKNYFYRRRPHNPLGVLLGRIITAQRHLDLVIAGSTPFENEIDLKSWDQYVTCEVRCSQMISEPSTCQMMITPKGFMTPNAILSNVLGKTIPYKIDGREPRPSLGLWISESGKKRISGFSLMTDFERKVLSCFDEQPRTLDEIVRENGFDIDNVDNAIQTLIKFGYLDGYGYFDIFHSKNYTNLQPALRRNLRGV